MRTIASSHASAAVLAAFACVIAFSSCGNPAGGSGQNAQSVEADLSGVAPVPSSLSGSTNAALKPTFSWFPTFGATSYELYLSTESTAGSSPLVSDIADTSYTPTAPLSYLTTYYWKLVAKNASSTSLPSDIRSFTTEKAPGFTAPAYLSPADAATSYPTEGFAWSPVSGATKYRFLCSTASDASGLIDWDKGTATGEAPYSYFFTPGYAWYWKIIAEDATSSSWDTSPVRSFTPKASGIAAPANIAVDSGYTISWDAVPGAVNYAILLNYGGTGFTKDSIARFETASCNASYLSEGQTIGYAVVAIDAAGNTSYAASVAAAKTFIIPKN